MHHSAARSWWPVTGEKDSTLGQPLKCSLPPWPFPSPALPCHFQMNQQEFSFFSLFLSLFPQDKLAIASPSTSWLSLSDNTITCTTNKHPAPGDRLLVKQLLLFLTATPLLPIPDLFWLSVGYVANHALDFWARDVKWIALGISECQFNPCWRGSPGSLTWHSMCPGARSTSYFARNLSPIPGSSLIPIKPERNLQKGAVSEQGMIPRRVNGILCRSSVRIKFSAIILKTWVLKAIWARDKVPVANLKEPNGVSVSDPNLEEFQCKQMGSVGLKSSSE